MTLFTCRDARRKARWPVVALLAASSALVAPAICMAADLPQNSTVSRGQVKFAYKDTSLTITPTSGTAVVEWKSFDIGKDSTVTINQTSASDLLVNRVTGTAASTLAGSLTANGQVFLINPNGITISKSGTVTAAGFVASSLELGTVPTSGPFNLGGNANKPGGISVAGKITGAGNKSYVVLSGGAVTLATDATISADYLGMASGSAATLTLPKAGADLGLKVTTSAKGGKINISGTFNARAGGGITLDAGTLADAVVNVDGQITADNSTVSITVGPDTEASGLRVGNALASTSTKIVPGQISFTGTDHAQSGLTINGNNYTLLWNAADVLAVNNDLTGRYALAGDIDFSTSKSFVNALIGPGTGASDGLAFSGYFNGLGHSLKNITLNGDNKRALVGVFAAVSGVSNNVPASISNLNINTINLTAQDDTKKTYKIGGLVGELTYGSLHNVRLSGGRIALSGVAGVARTIDGTGGASVGGLVGANQNGVIDHSFAAADISAMGKYSVIGGLVGKQGSGTLTNSGFRGTLAAGDFSSAGGLIGMSVTDLVADPLPVISKGRANATITAGDNANVGGLIGHFITGAVTSSWAIGSINAGASAKAGGLVGFLGEGSNSTAKPPTLTGGISTMTVTAGANSQVGGLAGHSDTGTLSNAFATGLLKAGNGSVIGGLVGVQASGGSLKNSVYLTDIAGQGKLDPVGGGVGDKSGTITKAGGLTTAQLKDVAAAKPYLGGSYFNYKAGRYPWLNMSR